MALAKSIVSDLSHKDWRYFVDGRTYNCPFCKRRNVAFNVAETTAFSWAQDRLCWIYIVECEESECKQRSAHFSSFQLRIQNAQFYFPPQRFERRELKGSTYYDTFTPLEVRGRSPVEMDEAFFHHQPSSEFSIDARIPKGIRDPLSEAEECRVANHATGGTGCLRKAIYKLLKNQEIDEKNPTGAFYHYDERIDLLKRKLAGQPHVDSDFLDYLKAIHGLSSEELHENDWEDFDGYTLGFLIQTTKQVLHQISLLSG
jgi:hypothetical protein